MLFLLVLSLLVLVFFPLESRRGFLDTQTQEREEIEMG